MSRRNPAEDEEVKVRLAETESATVSVTEISETGELLKERAETHPTDRSVSPELSAGDVDARWDQAESSGDETPGGSAPTPDMQVVDEIGRAIGLTYQEGEPLRIGRKEGERDEQRWELDPASAEDYGDRAREEAAVAGPASREEKR